MKRIAFAGLFASLCLVDGCISQHSVRVDPIQLEPIQVTMDVNVRLQDERSDAGDEDAGDEGGGDAGPPADAEIMAGDRPPTE